MEKKHIWRLPVAQGKCNVSYSFTTSTHALARNFNKLP